MKHRFFKALTLLLVTVNIWAQDNGENHLGTWFEITSFNRISDKFSISGSVTNWNFEMSKTPQLYLGLINSNYHFSNNVFVSLGYGNGYIDTSFENFEFPDIKEHRIMQQILAKHKSKNIGWSHRLRFEQRFFKYTQESATKHRLRYRFKGVFPINESWFFCAYDEIHFVLNPFDFHQNRVYGALGYKINKNINAQFGYARHSFKTKSYNRLSFQLNLKYDLRKSG